MTADEFVRRLIEQMPEEKSLKSLGLGEDFVKQYSINKSLQKNGNSEWDDELLKLVCNYNADVIEIGQIVFTEPSTLSDYTITGLMEVDKLAVSKLTREVIVLDRVDNTHILYKCASDGSAFLDAMIIADAFLNKCLFEDGLWENQAAINDACSLCANAAGGDDYRAFYDDLLGYYE